MAARSFFILAVSFLLISQFFKLSQTQFAEGSLRLLRRVYEQCSERDEVLKCLKIQALKAVDRALRWKSLNLIDGVSLVSEPRYARTLEEQPPPLNETKLQKLPVEEIDTLLMDNTSRFLQGHSVQIKIPELVEEGRGRKRRKGGHHAALLWALAIKGSFLAMAYQGIAVMSGTALIVGKMALLLSAILGLKKLVNSNHEKTTFEIVKVPKYSESHTHSTSFDDEGSYHRSYDIDKYGVRSDPYRGPYTTKI